MNKITRQCMTCGKTTTNESGFCTVKGWDSCKNVFIGEYGSKPTEKELTAMIITENMEGNA
jgi:hypothetical protein